jgi:hypothetical protein
MRLISLRMSSFLLPLSSILTSKMRTMMTSKMKRTRMMKMRRMRSLRRRKKIVRLMLPSLLR